MGLGYGGNQLGSASILAPPVACLSSVSPSVFCSFLQSLLHPWLARAGLFFFFSVHGSSPFPCLLAHHPDLLLLVSDPYSLSVVICSRPWPDSLPDLLVGFTFTFTCSRSHPRPLSILPPFHPSSPATTLNVLCKTKASERATIPSSLLGGDVHLQRPTVPPLLTTVPLFRPADTAQRPASST